ncbi:hypothetical protein DHD05_01435 [Arenibacter sp. N53]|uniref:O-antigen ligase family protein n=1 Tax=Arenibacter TaxID=178469 RepID=UPI000CD494BF|nr:MULTISPECIES: hypothetical protein [Arenibacter]MCM4150239.1 hypothetical protein [Arenibacter sp. N53]
MRILLKLLFTGVLLELFLGGGGRVFEFGNTTLRILLFFFNIALVGAIYIFRSKIPTYVIQLSLAVISLLAFYVILGWLNGAPFALIAEDVKPLTYFFSVIFFSYYIDSEQRVRLLVSLIKRTSFLMAIAYIFIQILFYFEKIDFTIFYNYVNTQIASSEFYFRGTNGLFFYKGFLYMVVGLIFWIHTDKSKFKGLAIFIITSAMILSGTRGLILMFVILYALFYGIPLLLKLNFKILIITVVLIFGSLYFFKNIELGNKNQSDSVRLQQIQQVIERIDPISFFIGHGFGNGVPIRTVHMEIGYLEVFHKQGILGLVIWFIFFTVLYNAYTRNKNSLAIRKAFFLSILFVILISLTNPFFNNPIGISLFVISMSVFWTLNKTAENQNNFKLIK